MEKTNGSLLHYFVNDDVIVYIFTFLPIEDILLCVQKVCKKWKLLSEKRAVYIANTIIRNMFGEVWYIVQKEDTTLYKMTHFAILARCASNIINEEKSVMCYNRNCNARRDCLASCIRCGWFNDIRFSFSNEYHTCIPLIFVLMTALRKPNQVVMLFTHRGGESSRKEDRFVIFKLGIEEYLESASIPIDYTLHSGYSTRIDFNMSNGSCIALRNMEKCTTLKRLEEGYTGWVHVDVGGIPGDAEDKYFAIYKDAKKEYGCLTIRKINNEMLGEGYQYVKQTREREAKRLKKFTMTE